MIILSYHIHTLPPLFFMLYEKLPKQFIVFIAVIRLFHPALFFFSSLPCLIQVLQWVRLPLNCRILYFMAFFFSLHVAAAPLTVFSLVWGCDAVLLWQRLERTCKCTKPSLYFLIYFRQSIHEEDVCAIAVLFHIPLFTSVLSFTLLITHQKNIRGK